MIRITGDTHGDYVRFIENNMGDDAWNKDDFLIICGDFGFVFLDNYTEKSYLDYMEQKTYTILFCDGNHENFPLLYSYPEVEWNGGRVHLIRDNIFHLMRGQIYEINGKTIFTMGGAYSIDREYRRLGYSYWSEELPSKKEYEEATDNLAKHNNKVDIIITHTAPNAVVNMLIDSLSKEALEKSNNDKGDSELRVFLEKVYNEVEFDKWYFGHFHLDSQLDDKLTAVYYDVIDI